MFLQRLELNGFKSFARHTELEFDRGITAIVGPNGSGKSNIAEAVRWVMGEQSLKTLRGKKSTDVIFSGSDKATRLGLAEVALAFADGGGEVWQKALSVLDGLIDYPDNLAISRRVHRDGKGEYLVNKQPARLHDILLLLAQMNLSSKTYSVIGQGTVDLILSISGSERKDFFEEASGVKPLQIKRAEAERKMAHSEENLATAEIQLNELTPRLRSLTRQVKRLEKRSELETELRQAQYDYYGNSLLELRSENKKFADSEQSLSEQITDLETEVKQQQQLMFSLTKESSHSDKFSQAQVAYQDLAEQKNKLREKELQLKSDILHATKTKQQDQVPIAVVRQVESNYQKLLTVFRNILSLERQTQIEQSQLDKLFSQYQKLLAPLQPYLTRSDVSNYEKNLRSVQSEIESVDSKLSAVQQQIKDLAELEKKEKIKIWQTQNELQESQKKLSQLVNERNNSRVELARIGAHIKDIEAEVVSDISHDFLGEVGKWQSDKAKNQNPAELRNEIHKLKHELDLIGGIDPEVQQEYSEIKQRHGFLESQIKDLKNTITKLSAAAEELDETIRRQFSLAFVRINEEFQKYFKLLFKGGRSELKLIKGRKEAAAIDEFEDNEAIGEMKTVSSKADEIIGVEIFATPPGKKLKSISMLSGGERALTSIALICAIIANNPAPFVVLDEVDAALDEENSERFGEILEELSHKTQFIVITHNRATMERADLLYGVTMGEDGISKLLSLKLEAAAEYTNR